MSNTMGLIASLGLDEVTGDPNDVPVGRYDGIVSASEFVLRKHDTDPDKCKVSHVVTYKVTDGDKAGASKQVWYDLYTNIVDAEGNFPADVASIKGGKPAMTENNKNWYKKLLMDLTGCSQEEAKNIEPEQLLNIEVTFGVAERNGYRNVSFVERRNSASDAAGPVSIAGGATGFGGF